MITVRTCSCGRTHDAVSWSKLTPIARLVRDGQEWQRRRCSCGRSLEVTILEDDAATEIDRARYATATAYGRARLELAVLRAATAGRFERRHGAFKLARASARAERSRVRDLEALLEGIYRSRELRAPKQRLGRNIAIVVGDVDPMADTERPPATGAR